MPQTIAPPSHRELDAFRHRRGLYLGLKDPTLLEYYLREQKQRATEQRQLEQERNAPDPSEPEVVTVAPTPSEEMAKLESDWRDLAPRAVVDTYTKRALTLVEKKMKAVQARIDEETAQRKAAEKAESERKQAAAAEAMAAAAECEPLALTAQDKLTEAAKATKAWLNARERQASAGRIAGAAPGSLPEPVYFGKVANAYAHALRKEDVNLIALPAEGKPLAERKSSNNPTRRSKRWQHRTSDH